MNLHLKTEMRNSTTIGIAQNYRRRKQGFFSLSFISIYIKSNKR